MPHRVRALRPGIALALCVAALPCAASVRVGTYYPFEAKTPISYAGAAQRGAPESGWFHLLEHPGATYLTVHFVDFELAEGDVLLVSDGLGRQGYTLEGKGKMDAGTFWTRHVKGDTLLLQLIVAGTEGGRGFRIDEYAAGDVDLRATLAPQAVCGEDERMNAVCFRDTHPTVYAKSRAVARLLIGGGWGCTGSLVSPFNHVLTNNHCIERPSDAVNTDAEFMVEAPECDSPSCYDCYPGDVYSGATLVETNMGLDYSLLQLQEGDPAATYGYLELETRAPVVGEQIYFPQHSEKLDKRISYFSTHPADFGGVARIFSLAEPTCLAPSGVAEVGYYADGQPGASGSPVLALSSHKIVVLHHCGNCPNRGLPSNWIHPEIEHHLRGGAPRGGIAPGAIAVSADSHEGGDSPARAIDGDLATHWTSSASAGPHWLALDLGLAAPVTGFLVWHASAGGAPASQNTRAFEIQSAPDAGGPWSTEFVGSNPAQAASTSLTYAQPRWLRHLRLLVTDPGDGAATRVGEFEVFSQPVMIDALPDGHNVAPQATFVEASSEFDDNLVGRKAVDGVISLDSRWVSARTSPPHTLRLDLGAARTVTGFVFRQASAAGEPYNANGIRFQTARSTAGPWHTEALVLTDGRTHYEARSFVSPKTVRYVRLALPDPGPDAYARVPEFEVYAVTAPPTPTPTPRPAAALQLH